MNKALLLLIGVFIIGVGAYIASSGTAPVEQMEQKVVSEGMMEEEKMMDDEMDMMKDGMGESDEEMDIMADDMMKDEDSMMMHGGTYEAYSPEKLAYAETGKVIIFFKASWCPSCRVLDKDIQSNLDEIPDDVTILEVNYDTATELKQKYSITSQHTLVQVDAEGSLIKKWAGSADLAEVLAQL